MKRSIYVKAVTGTVGILVLTLAYQNCSNGQFEVKDQSSISSELNSISPSQNSSAGSSSRAVTKLATGADVPQIVLSDSPNGTPKDTYNPNQKIYGTVYGVGSSQVYACMGNSCIFHPGYRIQGSTYTDPNVDVSKLPNWQYQASDKTWRFTLDYSKQGDSIEKLVVHAYMPKVGDMADFQALGLENPYLRIETFVHVKTVAPSILFTTSSRIDPYYFGDQSYIDRAYTSQFPGAGYYKLGSTSAQLKLCLEKTNSGLCNNAANWKSASQMSYAKYAPNRKVWMVMVGEPTISPQTLGPLTGAYTIHSLDESSGTKLSKNFTSVVQQKVCAYRSTTGVFGPCSDPESMRSCTEAQVGATLQGTGSCKAAYSCDCRFE